MKLIAKYYINNYKIYSENSQLISQVQKNLTHAKQLSVMNPSGDLLTRVEQKKDYIILEYPDGTSTDAQIQYQQEQPLLRPPFAHELSLHVKWGDLKLIQTSRREFEVFLDCRKICCLTRMIGITKEIHVLDNSIPADFLGVIFSLAFLMLHDDDIEIV